jgi:hypothetical protein
MALLRELSRAILTHRRFWRRLQRHARRARRRVERRRCARPTALESSPPPHASTASYGGRTAADRYPALRVTGQQHLRRPGGLFGATVSTSNLEHRPSPAPAARADGACTRAPWQDDWRAPRTPRTASARRPRPRPRSPPPSPTSTTSPAAAAASRARCAMPARRARRRARSASLTVATARRRHCHGHGATQASRPCRPRLTCRAAFAAAGVGGAGAPPPIAGWRAARPLARW